MAKEGRRGNGEGSIYELADGSWRGFITLGYDRDGKQIRKFCRRQDAQGGRREAQRHRGPVRQPARPAPGEGHRRGVAAALRGAALARAAAPHEGALQQLPQPHRRGPGRRPSAAPHSRYRSGGFYAELMDAGLSPSTRQHIHHFFKAALREALRLELVERTPFDVIDTPKGGRIVTPRVWDPAEVRTFLAAAEGDRLYGAFYLMVTLGLRIGETMGLQWKDLEGERLHVRRTLTFEGNTPVLGPPKTRRGDRVIYLGSDVQRVLDQQRETQALERSMAPRWKDLDLDLQHQRGHPGGDGQRPPQLPAPGRGRRAFP